MNKRKGQSAMEYLMTYGWMILVVAIVGGAILAVVTDQPEYQQPEWYKDAAGVAQVDMSERVVRHAVTDDGELRYNFYRRERTFSKDFFQQVEYKYSGDEWVSYQYWHEDAGTTVELYKYEGSLGQQDFGNNVEPIGCPVNWYCEGVKE